MEAHIIPQLLIIAGTGRNTGKTTLACQIIRKFRAYRSIYAIKITPHFYKNLQTGIVLTDNPNLYIAEETDTSTGKDSSLMLEAGAQKSYFVMATNEYLCTAITNIIKLIPSDSLIVCESGGLRNWVVPGLFFMMDKINEGCLKSDIEKLKILADRVITFDGEKFDFNPETIGISGNQWTLKQIPYDTIL